MNLHVETQRWSPGTENQFVSMLETRGHLTVTVIAAPMPAPRGRGATPHDRTASLGASGVEDDLANATWEDAEWQ
jgi:hypothetical protein